MATNARGNSFGIKSENTALQNLQQFLQALQTRNTFCWTFLCAVAPCHHIIHVVRIKVHSGCTPWLSVSLGECSGPGAGVVSFAIVIKREDAVVPSLSSNVVFCPALGFL